MPEGAVAIVDIGSNSVRLVVYTGAVRSPAILFNEKIMAGLGKGVAADGALSPEGRGRALNALKRFRLLIGQMEVSRTLVVATAAVRDASNGAAFLAEVRALGFDAEILPGDREGIMAGLGVISAFPRADGMVGDLGGGSLELVDVSGGEARHSASLPLGVLRIPGLMKKGKALDEHVASALRAAGFETLAGSRPFYMVGGSWRALARVDMLMTGYPLPVTHEYRLPPARLDKLCKAFAEGAADELGAVPAVSLSRMPTLPDALAMLRALTRFFEPSALIVSSFGIREGLLYDALPAAERARDPLIEATRALGDTLGRFAEHGDLLDRWMAPVFADDPPDMARLRAAACLLSDVGWQANPDFRAERGVDIALHGNWVGIDGPGRVMIAAALFAGFGGGGGFHRLDVARLCDPARIARATLWGLAIRLGQRMSGGLAGSLERSRLERRGAVLRLALSGEDRALYGEIVERRHRALAQALGLTASVSVRT